MDVKHLRAFVAVAEERNFGRGATRIGLSSSPVTRMIHELERELGASLFVRAYHAIDLTPAGRDLLPKAREFLHAFEDLAGMAQPLPLHTIRLGLATMAPISISGMVTSAARSTGHRVTTVLESSPTLLGDLRRSAVDVALVNAGDVDDGFGQLVVYRYHWGIAMRHDDELAGRPEVNLAELTTRTMLFQSHEVTSAGGQLIRDQLAAAGITSFEDIPEPDTARLSARIYLTGAVTLVPTDPESLASMGFNGSRFAVVPLVEPPFSSSLRLMWLRDRAAEPTVASVVTLVAANLGAEEPCGRI